MRAQALGIVALIALLGGCATASGSREGTWLPDAARSDPSKHVVVTVHNGANRAPLGVGSTPRGYGSVASYTATREAREQAHELEKRYGLHAVAAWPISVLDVYCLVYRIADGADPGILLSELKSDPRVESAQPLVAFSTQSASFGEARYNDTYVRLQRNLAELAVPQAQLVSRGAGVRIAVIDTGVAVDHPDLEGRIAGQRNFIDADEARFRNDRHGTAVAGVIAAVANNNAGIVGIAPEVRLLAYKACWETSVAGGASCNTFTLALALAAAIDARVDIVNLSLAGPSDPLLTRLVTNAQRRGIIFVGAAAASGAGFPVDIEGVIGVETLESGSPRAGLISAPGKDIFTLTPANHYDAASGSSLAAAEVSAMIALLRARDSRLEAARARRLLEASARPISTPEGLRPVISACQAMTPLSPGMSCHAPELPSIAEDARIRR